MYVHSPFHFQHTATSVVQWSEHGLWFVLRYVHTKTELCFPPLTIKELERKSVGSLFGEVRMERHVYVECCFSELAL